MKGNRGTHRKRHWIEVFILLGDLVTLQHLETPHTAEKLHIHFLDVHQHVVFMAGLFTGVDSIAARVEHRISVWK